MSPGSTDPRPPERADFAGVIRAPRRRPPLVALGWVVALGGIVALGLSGHTPPSGATSTAAPAAALATGVAIESIGRDAPPPFQSSIPTFPTTVVVTSEPGPINLSASRHPSSVFVHGDVFAQQVTWVFVSLLSLDGQVGGWASVSIPGAAGDGRDHRPALRFDVELAIPTGLATGVLVVQANAYNSAGSLVAATRVRLPADL